MIRPIFVFSKSVGLGSLPAKHLQGQAHVILVQQTREFRLRKPPWVAKSREKRMRVPERHEQATEEKAYMTEIRQRYQAQMRSVYALFKTEFRFSDKESLKVQEEKRLLREKEERLLAQNQKKNAEILRIQLSDLDLKLVDSKANLELEYISHVAKEKALHDVANEQVVKLKRKAQQFIDPSQLEYEIEKALDQRYDYNFSIDTAGLMFKHSNVEAVIDRDEAFDPKFLMESANASTADFYSNQDNDSNQTQAW